MMQLCVPGSPRKVLAAKGTDNSDGTATLAVSSGGSGATADQVQGNVAHDGVDTGNPVKVGGKAYAPDSGPADVSSGDRADMFVDLKGRPVVYLGTKLDSTNDVVSAEVTKWIGSTAPTVGQKAMASSLPVALASDDAATASLALLTVVPTRFANLGANATLNVKASAGKVFAVSCNNANAADRYLQLHNTATVPAGAAVPLYTFRVPLGGDIVIGTDFFTQVGAAFSTGIAFAFSTTRDTYTAGVAGDQATIIHYA